MGGVANRLFVFTKLLRDHICTEWAHTLQSFNKASRTNSRCLYLPLTPAVIPMLTAKNNRLLISSSKRSCPISLETAVRGRMALIKLIGRSPNTSWCSCIASSLGVILELLLKKPILPLISHSSCARKPEVLCAMRPGLNRDFSARRDSVPAQRPCSLASQQH